NASIIVFDGVISAGLIDIKTYLKGLDNFINIAFGNSSRKVYFKFHPAQNNAEKEEIHKYLNTLNNLEFIRIADEVILEELIVEAKNLEMYFNFSTISIYANNLGHKCFSFAEILGEL